MRKIKTGHLLALLTSGHIAMWSILAVGLFNSIMFACIFSLAVAEVGPLTGNGSGTLNMAIQLVLTYFVAAM